MRVLFVTWAWRTHLYPSVPLAWSFYAAGHQVRVACPPALSDEVVRAGLPAVPVGKDHDLSARIREDPNQLVFAENPSLERVLEEAKRSFGLLAEVNDAMLEDTVEFARRWRPDLVIWDPITFAGAIAARCVEAADARILWGPDVFMHRRQTFAQMMPRLPGGMRSSPLVDWFSAALDRYGLPMREADMMGRWTIDPCPPRLRLPVRCDLLSMRYVPYNGSAVAPEWLLDPPGKPRILLTPGTSTIRLTGGDTVPIAASAQALADLDVEVVLAVSEAHRDLFGEVPSNVRVVESVPLHLMLPSCAAVVHQGGAGTTLTAAVFGLPQVVIPQIADQVTNAKQVAAAGAGLSLAADQADAQTVRDSVAKVLGEPSYAAAAGAIREEIRRQPRPADVVHTLEELVGDHSG
jgi:glycosyltransferase (activator-dependent family)